MVLVDLLLLESVT